MNKPIIAIDIDDVVADSTESLRQTVNSRLSINLSREDYVIDADYWGYYERVWENHGITDVDYDDLHSEMAIDQSHVPLLPGAAFAIGEISKRFDIAMVTARSLKWEKATLEWLKKHFGEGFLSVHFAGSKSGKSKGELCSDIGAKILIDDNVGHCISAKDNGMGAILFGDYGWQKGDMTDIVRCKDWPEVLRYLDGVK